MNDITVITKDYVKPRKKYSKYRWVYEKIDTELKIGQTMIIENLESVRKASSIVNGIRYRYGNKIKIHLDKNKGEDGLDNPYITLNWR